MPGHLCRYDFLCRCFSGGSQRWWQRTNSTSSGPSAPSAAPQSRHCRLISSHRCIPSPLCQGRIIMCVAPDVKSCGHIYMSAQESSRRSCLPSSLTSRLCQLPAILTCFWNCYAQIWLARVAGPPQTAPLHERTLYELRLQVSPAAQGELKILIPLPPPCCRKCPSCLWYQCSKGYGYLLQIFDRISDGIRPSLRQVLQVDWYRELLAVCWYWCAFWIPPCCHRWLLAWCAPGLPQLRFHPRRLGCAG